MSAAFGVPVAALLPLSEDVAANASGNVFCALFPDHPWSAAVRAITDDAAGLNR